MNNHIFLEDRKDLLQKRLDQCIISNIEHKKLNKDLEEQVKKLKQEVEIYKKEVPAKKLKKIKDALPKSKSKRSPSKKKTQVVHMKKTTPKSIPKTKRKVAFSPVYKHININSRNILSKTKKQPEKTKKKGVFDGLMDSKKLAHIRFEKKIVL